MKTRITRIGTNWENPPAYLFAPIFLPSSIRANSCNSCLPSLFFVLFAFFAVTCSASTNDLATALQKGLFEEEANHNYPAAIDAYQGVINRFDEDRKLAATAIFRVGEIYRKQGKTNEANAQYERVVREFSEQSALATLSRSYLAAPTPEGTPATTNVNSEAAPTSDEAEEVKKIRAMIRDSPDLINAQDGLGSTRLHTQATLGHVVVAQYLLQNGANPNLQNSDGLTPLHNAAAGGHKALVELLLEHGAKVDIAAFRGGTPLHSASFKGFRAIAEVLLGHGADVNTKANVGCTPLHAAAVNGFKSVAELFLSHGADVNSQTSEVRDQQGRSFVGTPLHIAVAHDDRALAELLLGHKANPNATNRNGDTPLHIAAQFKEPRMVELLIANKARVESVNKMGETPLVVAAKGGFTSTVSLLVAAGAQVNFQNPVDGNQKGWTPLLYAVTSKQQEAVALLLKNNADPNLRSERSYAPLMMAVWQHDPDTLASLLEAKANPNIKDEGGSTPATAAIKVPDTSKRKAILSLLLEHGADTEATDNDGATLLMIAVQSMDKDLAEMLLAHKANVNAQNPRGSTPLHYVASSAYSGPYEKISEIAELLFSAGANPNLQNDQGKTPLSSLLSLDRNLQTTQAQLTVRSKVADLLRSHGGVANLPRLDVIEVKRSEVSPMSSVIFWKGTNGWEPFTLFELIGVQYKLLSAAPRGESRPTVSVYGFYPPGTGLDFPDFSHIRIRHPKSNLKDWNERVVDISSALADGDCSVDVPLELGDQVEIPEADHVLNAKWEGLSTNELQILKKCLTRQVSIVVKGVTKSVTLGPTIIPTGTVGYDANSRMAQEVQVKTLAPFMIKPALIESKLLLASSDLSRIKLIRVDANGQKRELIADCSSDKPAPSVWLRDGDVIEVPDKP